MAKIRTNQEILEEIKTIVGEKIGMDSEDINDTDDFDNDLSLDSLDKIEILMECEKSFDIDIHDDLVDDCKNCKELADILQTLL